MKSERRWLAMPIILFLKNTACSHVRFITISEIKYHRLQSSDIAEMMLKRRQRPPPALKKSKKKKKRKKKPNKQTQP